MVKDIFFPIVHQIRLSRFRKNWRRNNSHNQTLPNNIFPIEKVKVGRFTYGELNIKSYGNEDCLLTIGDFCSIAGDVVFVLDGEHNYRRFSSYPFPAKVFHEKNDSGCRGPIIVEDDVWIGYRATILSGAHLGKGCVIGAGTTVRGDIPPYSIYVDGEIMKYRFEDELITDLLKFDFSALDKKKLVRLKEYCFKELTKRDISALMSIMNDSNN